MEGTRTSTVPRVAADGVGKVFPTKHGATTALSGLSLSVNEGDFVCIVGPSGCGKSTFLRILGGLEEATSGSVRLADKESGEAPSVAFVFQEHGLFPWRTVLDNVAFGLQMAGVPRAERYRTAREWIERVQLSGFEGSYPDQLSGGMKQRVSIARAFSTDPDVLMMDEPLGALDAQTRSIMQEELITLWETNRKTVVLVTHSIEEAILLGDRILLMTARPGSEKATFPVPFGRPRSLELKASPEFGELELKIWEALRDEVQAAMTSPRDGEG